MGPDDSSSELERKIVTAFPSPYRPSHEDCLEIRRQLFSAEDKEVPNLLGPVLLDLVSNHSRSTCEPATASSVVRFLASANPAPLDTVPHKQFDTSQIDDFTVAQQRESKELFSKFSEEQASAIAAWLLAALSWNEPHLPEDEVKAALKYWSEDR
jgi:hypothetical protein